MKAWLLIVFLLFKTATVLFGQNIVPNYSFELYDSCPTKAIWIAHYGTGHHMAVKNWVQATMATTDYYNACATFIKPGTSVPWVGVPANGFGQQPAYEGEGYCGCISFQPNSDWSEYLMVDIPPLEVDTPYEVSVQVSLADNSRYAVGGFGVLFTTYGSPDTANVGVLNLTPQADFSSEGIITDTLGWTQLSCIFVPDSSYKSLIFGRFESGSGPDTLDVRNTPFKSYAQNSYYYIDNVSVRKLSSINVPIVGSAAYLHTYPNPTHDLLNVVSNEQEIAFEITNLLGQVQLKSNTVKYRATVDVSILNAGVYFLRTRNGHMTRFIKN